MADISDVEISLSALLVANFGAGAPFWAGSAEGARVFRGHPKQFLRSADRSARTIDIGVSQIGASTQVTTRWLSAGFQTSSPPGITVTDSANAIEFSGTANTGDLSGCLVNGQAFSYLAEGGESAALIAALLCDQIRQRLPCVLSGATITVPSDYNIRANCFGPTKVLNEISRQRQEIEITVWCASASMRDKVGAAIGVALDATPFLQLADGSAARLLYQSTRTDDTETPASIFLRILIYSVEYSTFSSARDSSMLFGVLDYNHGQSIT